MLSGTPRSSKIVEGGGGLSFMDEFLPMLLASASAGELLIQRQLNPPLMTGEEGEFPRGKLPEEGVGEARR